MKKLASLLFLLLSLSNSLIAQDLSCDDFKKGTFYIPVNDELKKFTIESKDSIAEIATERELNVDRYVIVREDNIQTEWENGINNGEPIFVGIEWIDECTYRLTYDTSNKVQDEKSDWINENNGLVVSKVKIVGKCMTYKATMTTANDKLSQLGTLCKM